MVGNKRGFMILRAIIAVWLGIGGLVALVVLHPLVSALVASFIAGSTDTVQIFAVRMIELFFVLVIFISVLITLVTGE